MSKSPSPDKIRLDKWLWAARFFKTRTLATEAVNGGKVHVNEARAKPARGIRLGDVLYIRRGAYEFVVEVRGLSEQRGPASQASFLYQETAESRQRREAMIEQRRALAAPHPQRRPTKKERRRIIRFTQQD